jgi:hypothetical protein
MNKEGCKMKRQTYEAIDGRTLWFDVEKADEFDEDTNWNGSNNISVPTGTQTEHEILYKTRKGAWVLNEWSQWQGSIQTWKEIEGEVAAQWLIQNSHYNTVKNTEDYEG